MVSAAVMRKSNEKLINLTIMICSLVLATIGTAFVIFLYRRNANFREKIKGLMKMSEELRKFDYQVGRGLLTNEFLTFFCCCLGVV